MKKLFFLAIFSISTLIFAQDAETQNSSWNPYVSVGYSIGNTDSGTIFKDNTYVTVEAGLQKERVALGLAVGRGNLNQMFSEQDSVNEYFAQVSGTVYFSIQNKFDLFLVGGAGSFFTNDAFFVEYGLGAAYKLSENISFAAKYSNWYNKWYVTPTLSFGF